MTQATPAALWPEKNAAQALALGRLVNVPPRMGFEWNWGDPLPYGLAFTGDANRTWVDANGVVQPAPRNMNQWSEDLSNAWYTPGAAGGAVAPAVTANAGAAPDGNNTASKAVFVAPGSGDSSVISTGTMTPVVAGAPYTGSFYVKAFAAGDVGKQILFRGAAGSGYTTVTLTTAWQRVSATETAFTTSSDFEICLRPAEGGSTGTVSVLIWGVQFQPGSAATTYLKTTTATVFGPRNDGYVYDKNGLLVPAWLIEASSTNRCLQSQSISVASGWGINGTSATLAGSKADPFGTSVATQITAVSSGASVSRSIVFAGDGEKCLSVYVKQGTAPSALVSLYDATAALHRHAVLITWTGGVPTLSEFAGAGTRFTPQPHTGGWWRILFSATGVVAANTNTLILYADDATGTAGHTTFYVGAQAEDASFPSSYIPTAAATVTRAAETATVPWGYVPQAMTMYAKFVECGTVKLSVAGIAHVGIATIPFFGLFSNVSVYEAEHANSVTGVGELTPSAPAIGDAVELRALLYGDGTVQIGQSIDAAAEAVSLRSPAIALAGAWSNPRLCLNGDGSLTNYGFTAFQSIRLALGDWSMDQMRKLAVDPNRSTFSPTGTPTGSLVSNARGYAVTPGDLTGTGKVAFVRNVAKGVIY